MRRSALETAYINDLIDGLLVSSSMLADGEEGGRNWFKELMVFGTCKSGIVSQHTHHTASTSHSQHMIHTASTSHSQHITQPAHHTASTHIHLSAPLTCLSQLLLALEERLRYFGEALAMNDHSAKAAILCRLLRAVLSRADGKLLMIYI